jgi:GR25 family glycosyltransferase involved in LPS biosynthesis
MTTVHLWNNHTALVVKMLIRIVLLICALCSGSLWGSLQDHLKKASHKGAGHRMKNIDFIYLINLDARPEKFASCIRQLTPYGIHPYRFSAINGWALSLDVINDVGVKFKSGMTPGLLGTYYPTEGDGSPAVEIMSVPGRTYFHANMVQGIPHAMARGTIGCALSHLSVLQDALDSGYKTIWVMEDDIAVLRNPHLISKYIDALDSLVGENRWDMLFTDQDTISNQTGDYVPCTSFAPRPNFTPSHTERFTKKIDVSTKFRKIGARYGMYSVIIRRSGMKKILEFIKRYKLFLPIDMDYIFPHDMRMYSVQRDIVSTQRNALTDNIRQGFLNKKSKQVKKTEKTPFKNFTTNS